MEVCAISFAPPEAGEDAAPVIHRGTAAGPPGSPARREEQCARQHDLAAQPLYLADRGRRFLRPGASHQKSGIYGPHAGPVAGGTVREGPAEVFRRPVFSAGDQRHKIPDRTPHRLEEQHPLGGEGAAGPGSGDQKLSPWHPEGAGGPWRQIPSGAVQARCAAEAPRAPAEVLTIRSHRRPSGSIKKFFRFFPLSKNMNYLLDYNYFFHFLLHLVLF